MDKLDIRIIRELTQGDPLFSSWPTRPRRLPSFNALSRKLGVAESTIRERAKKLRNFLPGWTLILNPSVMGEKQEELIIDVPPGIQKDGVLKKIGLIEDMLLVINYVGSGIFCSFNYRNKESLGKKVKLIMSMASCQDCDLSEVPFPDCKVKLSGTDLQIVASLQEDMSKSDAEVAEELGISARTVKRRYARLAQGGAIMPRGHVSMEALKDSIRVDLVVHYREGQRLKTESEVHSLVDDYLMFDGQNVEWSGFDLIVPGVSMAQNILSQVRGLAGVRAARVDIVASRFEFFEVFNGKVEQLMESLKSPN